MKVKHRKKNRGLRNVVLWKDAKDKWTIYTGSLGNEEVFGKVLERRALGKSIEKRRNEWTGTV